MNNQEQGFKELGIAESLQVKLQERSIVAPTPIQQQAIPVVLAGEHVVAQSQTGTGKTLAFVLPLLQRIDVKSKDLQAIVLVPTRELGMQISREAQWLGEDSGLEVQTLIGGASLKRQVEKLREHPQLVVGTPGRIRELLQSRKLNMQTVRTIVMDEVDQIFALGSTTEVLAILKAALRDCQKIVFSATIPPQLAQLENAFDRPATHIRIAPEQKMALEIEHHSFECEERDKVEILRKMVHAYPIRSAIVFVNEQDTMRDLLPKLQYVGLSVQALYGDQNKQERSNVLDQFRQGKFQLLLASDLAARGLDIAELSHVVHFDPARDPEHYVHRSGRTGRMGHAGIAVTLITPRTRFILRKLERELDIQIAAKSLYKGKVMEAKETVIKDRGSSGSKDRPYRKPQPQGSERSQSGKGTSAFKRKARGGEAD